MQIETPELKEGETYLGAVVNPDGTGYRSVLLPGDHLAPSWDDHVAWAKSIGGELPNRIEQAILNDKFSHLFKKAAYWSGETHKDNPAYAWFQYFTNGNQYRYPKTTELRGRAVRRLPLY